MHPLEKYSHLYEDDLKQVDEKILSFAEGSKAELISALLKHIIQSGGKRLRPILLILSTKLFNVESDKAISMAACVELLHTATLFHDDVVDESKLRRGRKTANEIWGNAASVLVGDFLLAKAFGIMSGLGNLELINIIANTSSIITEGEVKQLSFKNNINISEEDYLDIITAKTAELFSACCQVGAELAEQNSEDKKRLESFGRNLGIAFQIADDVLDYVYNEAETGKKAGDDFREGKVTMPVIYLYQGSDESVKQGLKEVFSGSDELRQGDEFTKILSSMKDMGSIEYTINKAKSYSAAAKNSLNVLDKASINQEVYDAIIEILDFSVDRNF